MPAALYKIGLSFDALGMKDDARGFYQELDRQVSQIARSQAREGEAEAAGRRGRRAPKLMILGIETSCDECSAAVVRQRRPRQQVEVLSVATFSQIGIHQPYGGVVPEIASRNHLETVNEMIDQALTEAGGSGREARRHRRDQSPGPGGRAARRRERRRKRWPTRSRSRSSPCITSKATRRACSSTRKSSAGLSAAVAIVSGGHTNLYVVEHAARALAADFLERSLVGRSRDDAAGEAFDKTAKLLGFPYPGGVWIDKTAQRRKSARPSLFRARFRKEATLDFSSAASRPRSRCKARNSRQKGQLEGTPSRSLRLDSRGDRRRAS